MSDNFISLEAELKHTNNSYHLYLMGKEADTNFQMVDPGTNGKYMLIVDRAHPIGIIFNEESIDFKGVTFDQVLEKYLLCLES